MGTVENLGDYPAVQALTSPSGKVLGPFPPLWISGVYPGSRYSS